MRIYEIIENKRDGKALTKSEIDFFISEYSKVRDIDANPSMALLIVTKLPVLSISSSKIQEAE